jgi:hypothetical protein
MAINWVIGRLGIRGAPGHVWKRAGRFPQLSPLDDQFAASGSTPTPSSLGRNEAGYSLEDRELWLVEFKVCLAFRFPSGVVPCPEKVKGLRLSQNYREDIRAIRMNRFRPARNVEHFVPESEKTFSH